jgi:hypothetical protein
MNLDQLNTDYTVAQAAALEQTEQTQIIHPLVLEPQDKEIMVEDLLEVLVDIVMVVEEAVLALQEHKILETVEQDFRILLVELQLFTQAEVEEDQLVDLQDKVSMVFLELVLLVEQLVVQE